MNVLAIIPARAGSKRLPGKNKRKLAGKELVRYAIEAALSANLVSHCVLSSDDADILAIGNQYPRLFCIERPAAISTDQAPAITYVEHALEKLSTIQFDYVLIVQPTSPFTVGDDIDQTLVLLQRTGAASAASVTHLDHALHPYKIKLLNGDILQAFWEEEEGRMAAHELPQLFIRNGSVYAAPLQTILKGQIIANPCSAYIMPRERSIDINDAYDFAFAEFLMGQQGVKLSN